MHVTAETLRIPLSFNAATYFVDRHVGEGRAGQVAIECGDERVTYGQVHERVNRFGSALRDRDRRATEERILLLLLDGPAFDLRVLRSDQDWCGADSAQHAVESRRLRIRGPRLGRLGARRQPGAPAADREDGGPMRAPDSDTSSSTGAEFDALIAGRGRSVCGPSRPTATPRRSGCTRPAAPASRRRAFTCSTTWSSARSCSGRASSASRSATGRSASRSCSSRTASATRCRFRFRSARRPCSCPVRRPPRTCTRRSNAIARRCSTRCRPGYGMMLAHPPGWPNRPPPISILSSIRLAVSAGEALPPALYERFKQRFGVDIIDGIGSTEALHMFISNRPGAIRPGSSGQVVDGYDARLLDDEARRFRDGEIGNLWIRGDSVCAGYWNQHEKTKDTIEGHWIRTGDKYSQGRGRVLLVRGPIGRHAQGRWTVGQSRRGRKRAGRPRRRARMWRRRTRGS